MQKPTGIKSLTAALRSRIERVVQVFDDALNSSEFKERIWAVEQILKRLKPEEKPATSVKGRSKPQTKTSVTVAEDLSLLSEEELLSRIQGFLQPLQSAEATDDEP